MFQNNLDPCAASCDFLRSMHVTHAGTCPSPEHVILSHNGCGDDCAGDSECAFDRKCCATTCGATCHPPVDQYAGLLRHLRTC